MRRSSNNLAIRRRVGFTLVEMLVVISIIVLVIGMAIPLFKSMSGDRSVESAENIVSSMLQRARSRAIGLQAPRGVFFFEDQQTKKTAMVMVRIDDPSDPRFVSGANPMANVLELDEDSDEFQFLPAGVGAAFVLGATPSATPSGGTAVSSNSVYKPYGLVVFDETGRMMTIPSYTTYATADPRYPTPPGSASGVRDTRLRFRYESNIGKDVMDKLGKSQVAADQQFSSQVVMLYDKIPFAAQDPATPAPLSAFSAAQSAWLDNNGLAIAVNRYNGTILKSQ